MRPSDVCDIRNETSKQRAVWRTCCIMNIIILRFVNRVSNCTLRCIVSSGGRRRAEVFLGIALRSAGGARHSCAPRVSASSWALARVPFRSVLSPSKFIMRVTVPGSLRLRKSGSACVTEAFELRLCNDSF